MLNVARVFIAVSTNQGQVFNLATDVRVGGHVSCLRYCAGHDRAPWGGDFSVATQKEVVTDNDGECSA